MDSSYAPLGPIVSIVPTERRSAPVALAVGAVAVLLLGFLALAATMVLRGNDAEAPAAAAAQANVLGDTPTVDSAPSTAAVPPAAAPAVAVTDATPTHAAAPAAAPVTAASDEDRPQARSEARPRSHRRVARRARHARARHASRPAARRQERPAARTASRTESRAGSDEPRRLTPTRSSAGFGNSSDVMRSLGL